MSYFQKILVVNSLMPKNQTKISTSVPRIVCSVRLLCRPMFCRNSAKWPSLVSFAKRLPTNLMRSELINYE